MSEELSFNFAEYAKPIAKYGKLRRLRRLFIFMYILVAAAYIGVAVAITIPQIIAILPLFMWIFIHFTWRAVSYECCVRVDSGKISFLKLRDKREQPRLTIESKDILFAVPYSAEAMYEKENTVYDFRADEREAGYLLCFAYNGKKAYVRFECTLAVARAMHYYNKDVTVDKDFLKL